MTDEYNLFSYLIKLKDPLPNLRVLLSYPLCNWVNEFFLTTRNYYSGLKFTDYANEIICNNTDRITPGEYERMDKKLTTYKLVMLDFLNDWDEYINLFDNTLANKKYYVLYPKHAQKHIKDKYILLDDGYFISAHFLCFMDKRYSIINRKLSRQKVGKSTEHLRRHHQYMLSDEEIEKRYKAIINKLEILIRR